MEVVLDDHDTTGIRKLRETLLRGESVPPCALSAYVEAQVRHSGGQHYDLLAVERPGEAPRPAPERHCDHPPTIQTRAEGPGGGQPASRGAMSRPRGWRDETARWNRGRHGSTFFAACRELPRAVVRPYRCDLGVIASLEPQCLVSLARGKLSAFRSEKKRGPGFVMHMYICHLIRFIKHQLTALVQHDHDKAR